MIHVEEKDGVYWLTLDRPPLNILNLAMIEEIVAALKSLDKSRGGILVFQAKGKAFSAGADVADHLPGKVASMLEAFHEIFYEILSFDGPVISLVGGPALGGGCELALAADIALASSRAQFGQPEIKLGVFAPVSLVLYPLLCTARASLEIILSGQTLEASQALQVGLISKVFEDSEFEAKTGEYIQGLRSLSLSSLKITKQAFRKIHPWKFKERLKEAEQMYLDNLMQTKDAREGCFAFVEKRKPVWSHS